jgi:lon-related putative ATP-dependent protease
LLSPIPAHQLRLEVDPADFNCEHTGQLTPLTGIIGQQRAVHALQFGLGIKARGFNLYISGPPGTGRTSAATEYLRALAVQEPTPPDWVYVNNFKDPYKPVAIRLPAGRGRALAEDVRQLIESIRTDLPKAFEAEAYTERRNQITEALSARRRDALSSLTQFARDRGMAIQATPAGFMIIPIREDRPVPDQEIDSMEKPERDDLLRRRDEVEARLKAVLSETRAAEKEAAEALGRLDREVVTYAIGHLVDDLLAAYGRIDGTAEYLNALREDVIENLRLFRGGDDEGQPLPKDGAGRDTRFRRYAVNVVVDNSETQGAPVIVELNPTYTHLFGKIEKESFMGALTTDFTLLRSGAVHRANGGYLVLPVRELLTNIFSYDSLKLALRSRQISIEELAERLGMTAMKSLQPQPVPLDVKVVLIGDPTLHFLLHAYDPDFGEMFKVKAEFGVTMDRTPEHAALYASFLCTLCAKESLRHLESNAIAALVEHSSRLAGDQGKLSTEFSAVADIVREADFYAASERGAYIGRRHIEQAIEQRHLRSNLIEERLRELIEQGVILIDTDGAVPGQVNGLSVLSVGDMAFGVPARITATVGLGRAGVVDIEREARLSGPIHTKGQLIMGGFLTERYARRRPLSLSARLVFEQSYGMVEGDSASLAETCVLLSALAGAPIRQSLAITGSINQKGQVQAVGGINEKVEGFFATCRLRRPDGSGGLDGSHGVIIPRSNMRHLMLKPEVLAAVRAGLFSLYAVSTVDEALALLTGLVAGEPDPCGCYPAGTLNALVEARLADLAERMIRFGAPSQTTVTRTEAPPVDQEPRPPQPPPVAQG